MTISDNGHAMRNHFEELEDKVLAPYALKSGHSLGRKYPEPPDPYRTTYQRDRDRIIHSKAFRRLKQKTQVVGVFSGDHFRTRLTHSLEVAQISRQLARMLGLNEDVVETIALAHDLGHPPFGHVGETVLDRLMKAHGGFEHNQQSRRIVEYIEQRYPSFPGLNLSYEILDGLIKHATPYDNAETSASSCGNRIFSLEAEIVNIADEIAYNSHDLDDGIRAGILPLGEVEQKLTLWQEATEDNRHKYVNITLQELHRLNISTLIGYQVVDVWRTTTDAIREYGITSREQLQHIRNIVTFSPNMQKKNKQLRSYLYHNFYRHRHIEVINEKGIHIVERLFALYLNNPELLPASSNRFIEDVPLERRIADYIASMTDNFAEETLSTMENTP